MIGYKIFLSQFVLLVHHEMAMSILDSNICIDLLVDEEQIASSSFLCGILLQSTPIRMILAKIFKVRDPDCQDLRGDLGMMR